MNIKYNILWIDDSDEYVEATQHLIERVVENNHMSLSLKTYNEYDEFIDSEIKNFNKETFNLYDLILIDYALSGASGKDIINDIRSRDIFTDIVFYSSDYESMLESLSSREPLNGVYFERREDLTSAIHNVIKKNLKREYSISNIRGLLMDSTSEFDFVSRVVTLEQFNKLTSEKQFEIVEQAKQFVEKAKQKSDSNFGALNKDMKYSKYMRTILNSVDYVIDNADRYALLLSVFNASGKETLNDFDVHAYDTVLIKPRNKLAHNKIYIGQCRRKLFIAKKRNSHACDQNCIECKSSYSLKEFETMRREIFKYHKMFEDLYGSIFDETK